jgi:hypothetical protein
LSTPASLQPVIRRCAPDESLDFRQRCRDRNFPLHGL